MTPGLSQPRHGTAIHHLFTRAVLAASLQLGIHLPGKARGIDEAPRAHLPWWVVMATGLFLLE